MIQSTHTTTTNMEAHYIMADRYTMKSHPLPSQLTPQQETAIDLILAGKNDREVAESIGKSRSTINVWRNQDPLFMATLNNQRQQVRGSQLSRLNTLVSDAVDALQDGLHDEDIKVRIVAAVHILKATGVYGAEAPGTQKTDPAEIAADRDVKEEQRKDRCSNFYASLEGKPEYKSCAAQQSYFFAKEQGAQLAREIDDANQYFKIEADKEKIAYWEQLLPMYGAIPQETLDTLDDAVLRQLTLDYAQTRDTYLKTLKDDLIHAANPDRPVWDDYTEEITHQVDMEVERAKGKTDDVLQLFTDAWERRGGDPAELLNRSKRKRRKGNPMLLQNQFQLPMHGET